MGKRREDGWEVITLIKFYSRHHPDYYATDDFTTGG